MLCKLKGIHLSCFLILSICCPLQLVFLIAVKLSSLLEKLLLYFLPHVLNENTSNLPIIQNCLGKSKRSLETNRLVQTLIKALSSVINVMAFLIARQVVIFQFAVTCMSDKCKPCLSLVVKSNNQKVSSEQVVYFPLALPPVFSSLISYLWTLLFLYSFQNNSLRLP